MSFAKRNSQAVLWTGAVQRTAEVTNPLGGTNKCFAVMIFNAAAKVERARLDPYPD